MTVVTEKVDEGDLSAAVALLRLVERSVLYRQPTPRPVTILMTTSRLSDALDSQLMLDSLSSPPSVLTVEERSAAHGDPLEGITYNHS